MDDPQPGPSGLSVEQRKNEPIKVEGSQSGESDVVDFDDVKPFEIVNETADRQKSPAIDDVTKVEKEKEPEKEPKKMFECSSCDLKECYDYYGSEPPFSKHVYLKEKCYVMEDPFEAPRQGEILVLGSDCVRCRAAVCRDVLCSFFFDGTHCVRCLNEHLNSFPDRVQDKIRKLREQNLHRTTADSEQHHDYYDLTNIKSKVVDEANIVETS